MGKKAIILFMALEIREKLNFLFWCWIRQLAMKLQKLHFADKVVRLRKVVLKNMFVFIYFHVCLLKHMFVFLNHFIAPDEVGSSPRKLVLI